MISTTGMNKRNDKHEKTSQDTVRRAVLRLPLAVCRALLPTGPFTQAWTKHNTTQRNRTAGRKDGQIGERDKRARMRQRTGRRAKSLKNQAGARRTGDKTTIQHNTTTRKCDHELNWSQRGRAAQHTNISEKDAVRLLLSELLKIWNFFQISSKLTTSENQSPTIWGTFSKPFIDPTIKYRSFTIHSTDWM